MMNILSHMSKRCRGQGRRYREAGGGGRGEGSSTPTFKDRGAIISPPTPTAKNTLNQAGRFLMSVSGMERTAVARLHEE